MVEERKVWWKTVASIGLGMAAVVALAGCGGETAPDGAADAASDGTEAALDADHGFDLDIPRVSYKWDPQAGDASVPAELGGPGFTGEGWTTKMEVLAIGSADAVRGGSMSQPMPDWPATVRQIGKDWNTAFNYFVTKASYWSALSMDTEDHLTPLLATHWQVSEDKTTYRFRINPDAQWSDGQPVVADDWVATWKLFTDPEILDPSANIYYGKFEEPVAVSKYIVEVKAKEPSWRSLIAIGGMHILPAHEIGSLTGAEYLDKYQFAFTAVTGHYVVKPEDVNTGNSITLTRLEKHWTDGNPAFQGIGNIEQFKFVVVKDPNLRFEKTKKGELDYFAVPKAQWWAESVPEIPAVKRGLLVPRKFHNDAPIGFSGIAINTKREPLDDIRIRQALQKLSDRKTNIEKLYFNEYVELNSYWQGPKGNADKNEVFAYDEFGAVELLEAAGWTEINEEGYRVKDGKVLEFALSYGSPLSERGLTVYQEACKKAGIKLDLQLLTPASRWKNMREKEFELSSTAWGAIRLPNPESMWHSKYAEQKDNNNVTSFADPEVDKLIESFESEEDPDTRATLLAQIDAKIYAAHPYVLEHYNPAQRVLYWNRYAMPEWGVSRFDDVYDMFLVWWVDPTLDSELGAALADENLTMELPEQHHKFWHHWNAKQRELAASTEEAPAAEEEATEADG